MISNHFLQANDFASGLSSILGGSFSEILGNIAPYIVFGIIIGTGITIAVIVYRALMTYKAFGEGMPLGRYRVINRAQRKIMVGYLSKSDKLKAREDLEDMAEEEELKPLAEIIMKYVEDEKLELYDYNVFDWGNAIRGRVKHVKILSNVKLELDTVSWMDETGNKTWRSILNKDYIRNVDAYSNSKYFEIKNPDRNFDGYYSLAVIPDVGLGKKGIIMSSLTNPQSEQVVISPGIVPHSKEISQAAAFIELIAEGHRKVRTATAHTNKLQELLSKEQRTNMALKMKVNKLRRILIQQILIGYAKAQTPLQQVNSMVWIFGCGVATLFGTLVVPEMDGVRDTNIPSWLVGGATILVIIIAKYLIDQKGKPIDGADVDERPENSEKIEL